MILSTRYNIQDQCNNSFILKYLFLSFTEKMFFLSFFLCSLLSWYISIIVCYCHTFVAFHSELFLRIIYLQIFCEGLFWRGN